MLLAIATDLCKIEEKRKLSKPNPSSSHCPSHRVCHVKCVSLSKAHCFISDLKSNSEGTQNFPVQWTNFYHMSSFVIASPLWQPVSHQKGIQQWRLQQAQNDNNQNKLEENKMAPSTTEDPYILWNKLGATTQTTLPKISTNVTLNFPSSMGVLRDMLAFFDLELHRKPTKRGVAFVNFTTPRTSAWLEFKPFEMHCVLYNRKPCCRALQSGHTLTPIFCCGTNTLRSHHCFHYSFV